MSVTLCDASIIVDTKPPRPVWAAFEYQASLEVGTPPSVIYVGACPLIEVLRLGEGRSNSEFCDIFRNGGHVLVRLIATGEREPIIRHALQHIRESFEAIPRCNRLGFNVKGMARAVHCSNGITYPTQSDAAKALGLSQSAVSQVLSGKLHHAGGFTFAYAVGRAPDVAEPHP